MASPFSGSSGRKAGMFEADQLGKTQAAGLGAIDAATGQSLSTLGKARDVYKAGQGRQLSALGEGYDAAQGFNQEARDGFQPYAEGGAAAFGSYQDALGLNGADGRARAVDAFRTGPGYDFMVNQSTDAAARKASALGLTASGNTLDAITRLGSNLADQEYGSYLDRLSGVSQMGMTATGQQAGVLQGMGTTATNYGQNRSNIYGQTAGHVGATFGQGAGIYQNAGNTKGQLISNIGTKIGDVGNKAMMAGQEAAATRMNFGLQTAGTLANIGKSFVGMGG
jgi:hypothetical protein